MHSFEYIARDTQSNKLKGTIDAPDVKSAVNSLMQDKLIPIRIAVPKKSSKRLSEFFQEIFLCRLLFLSIFTSSLSRLLRSGLTLPQARGPSSRSNGILPAGNPTTLIIDKIKSGLLLEF